MLTAITTTVRVIYGIHRHTTHSRSDTEVTLATGRADLDILVLLIADRAKSCHTL